MIDANSYRLTNAQKEHLREASVGQVAPGAALLGAGFPVDELARQLFASNSPFLVIDNLPVETLDSNWNVSPTPITSFVLAALLDALNLTIFGYRQEKDGALYHDLHPIPGAEQTHSNAGRVPFSLHTENPYLPRAARPTVLAIAGINNESNTETLVVPVARITERMPADIRAALEREEFTFRQSDSFQLNGYDVYRRNSAILCKRGEFDEFRWAITNRESTAQGARAIEWVKAMYEDVSTRVAVQPGQALVFNNHRCLHGRGAVEGRRWMKRVYGIDKTNLLDSNQLIDVWATLADRSIDHTF
jgi:Taurine catabolism dioxygenase TauD, TfdA family